MKSFGSTRFQVALIGEIVQRMWRWNLSYMLLSHQDPRDLLIFAIIFDSKRRLNVISGDRSDQSMPRSLIDHAVRIKNLRNLHFRYQFNAVQYKKRGGKVHLKNI